MSSSDVGKKSWRLFLAASLNDSVRSALAEPMAELDRLASLINRSRIEAIHLTLHFMGQVESSRVGELNAELARAIAPFAPFELLVSGAGAFPSRGRPRVIWAGISGPGRAELVEIHQASSKPLRSAGIVLEDRPYAPHLTLGRLRRDPRTTEREPLSQWMRRWEGADFGRLEVAAFYLIRSDLSARPPQYTVVESFALQ
jgi:2'-5' RNA ligase